MLFLEQIILLSKESLLLFGHQSGRVVALNDVVLHEKVQPAGLSYARRLLLERFYEGCRALVLLAE